MLEGVGGLCLHGVPARRALGVAAGLREPPSWSCVRSSTHVKLNAASWRAIMRTRAAYPSRLWLL